MPGRDPDVTDDEIIIAIRKLDYPFVTTREVADALETINQNATLIRLKSLRESGAVNGRHASGGWIWWLPEVED